MAVRRLAEELADPKEARAQAELRMEECRQVFKDRYGARRILIKAAPALPLAFVLSLVGPLPLRLGGVIGSLAEAQADDLILWLVFRPW